MKFFILGNEDRKITRKSSFEFNFENFQIKQERKNTNSFQKILSSLELFILNFL